MRRLADMVGAALLVTVLSAFLSGQGAGYRKGQVLSVVSEVPAACTPPDVVIVTTAPPTLQVCTTTNTFTQLGWSAQASGGLPAGAIVLADSVGCPAGTTEVTAMNGFAPVGTLAASGNTGTTLGSDTITPQGVNGPQAVSWPVSTPTVAGTTTSGSAHSHPLSWPAGVPTILGITASFLGSALAAHAHELPFQLSSTTATRQIAAATFGGGTARAATGASAAGAANTTSAAVALSQAVSGGTPAGSVTITSQGTVAWPAAVPTAALESAHTHGGGSLTIAWPVGVPTVGLPAFVGAPFDNRSASRRMLFCRGN